MSRIFDVMPYCSSAQPKAAFFRFSRFLLLERPEFARGKADAWRSCCSNRASISATVGRLPAPHRACGLISTSMHSRSNCWNRSAQFLPRPRPEFHRLWRSGFEHRAAVAGEYRGRRRTNGSMLWLISFFTVSKRDRYATPGGFLIIDMHHEAPAGALACTHRASRGRSTVCFSSYLCDCSVLLLASSEARNFVVGTSTTWAPRIQLKAYLPGGKRLRSQTPFCPVATRSPWPEVVAADVFSLQAKIADPTTPT